MQAGPPNEPGQHGSAKPQHGKRAYRDIGVQVQHGRQADEQWRSIVEQVPKPTMQQWRHENADQPVGRARPEAETIQTQTQVAVGDLDEPEHGSKTHRHAKCQPEITPGPCRAGEFRVRFL